MSELKGACIFGQSGGPTSVINASAYGVIATALKNPNITRVLGACLRLCYSSRFSHCAFHCMSKGHTV